MAFVGLFPTGMAKASYGITAGDLNGDQIADVVISYPQADSIAVHLGTCQLPR